MTETSGLLGGKYKLDREIGRGGTSRVYLAYDRVLNKRWAVKQIPEGASAALREARLLAEMDHPAFPRVVELIREEPYLYIVMDYADGISLEEILKEGVPLEEETALFYGRQICEILRYLHSKDPPVIYRDLKPANLILNGDGRVMVIDFGIARRYRKGKKQDTQPLGTRGYAAPEQYGSGQSDERSDIYAFGMILYRMLTGRDPASPGFQYVPAGRAAPQISEGTAAVIEKCIRPSPDDRYRNCAELQRDLEEPFRGTAAFKRKRKHRIHLLFLTLSLSAILFLCGIFFRGLSQYINEELYQGYLHPSVSAPASEKEASYLHACALRPERAEPYLFLLRHYQTEGNFGRTESMHFSDAFEKGRDLISFREEEGRQLLREAAMLYFYGYREEDAPERTRMLLALPYFELLCGTASDEKTGAEAERYLTICRFYEAYEGNLTQLEVPDQEEYRELINALGQCLEEQSGQKETVSVRERLVFCRAILHLTAEHEAGFVSAGIPEKEARELILQLIRCAGNTKPVTQQELQNKKEILEESGAVMENLKHAYLAGEEHKDG